MLMPYYAYCQTDKGRVRKRNEDNFQLLEDKHIFVVADGMGGLSGGHLASQIIVKTLPQMILQQITNDMVVHNKDILKVCKNAIIELSQLLYAENKLNQNPGIGSTVILMMLNNNQLIISHLGDSRAYLLRSKQLTQLTLDHNMAQLLLDNNEITKKESIHHFLNTQLTRFVGMKSQANPFSQLLKPLPNDRILLCTDGLFGMLSNHHIEQILNLSLDAKQTCQLLIDSANNAGGKDNITTLVFDWINSP